VISAHGVEKRVALPNGTPLQILRDLDLEVGAGEVVAIVGRSGAGKTTLLDILGLIDPFDSGSYVVDETSVEAMGDRDRAGLRARTFGFIFQQFHLLERRTAIENVSAPLAHASTREYLERRPRAIALLEAVGLSDRLESLPSQLSGGEQQRVAIARALVRSPKVLLADEPTGSLDTGTGQVVLEILLKLARDARTTLILATHDEAVSRVADRRLRLESGKLHGS
jgi:putative ABC transport system ATP-binding protein